MIGDVIFNSEVCRFAPMKVRESRSIGAAVRVFSEMDEYSDRNG